MSVTCTRFSGGLRALALAGPLALAGCAAAPPAPVESRSGAAMPPAVATGAAAAAGRGSMETAPGGATVIPLGPDQPAPGVPAAASASDSPPPAAAQRPVNPAVVALMDRAGAQRRSGQHAGAASSLERAIKIEPGNPWLWHRLAVTRLDQGRPGEAASLAAKSNSLAAGEAELQAENWRLIARVHRQRGEGVAARAAEDRARELSTPRT